MRSDEDAEILVELARERLADAVPLGIDSADAPIGAVAPTVAVTARSRALFRRILTRRRAVVRRLLGWYLSPSGIMFLAVVAAATAGVAGSRWFGLAALAGLLLFVPYKFSREQVRNDRRLHVVRDGVQRGLDEDRDAIERLRRDIERGLAVASDASSSAGARLDRLAAASEISAAEADSRATALGIEIERLERRVEDTQFLSIDAAARSAAELVSLRIPDPPEAAALTSAVDDSLSGRRAIFCASSGRSGTHYLARILGSGEYVYAVHEAAPYMIGHHLRNVIDRPLPNSYSQRRVKVEAIRATIAALPRRYVYAETNHMFIKTFHDVVVNEFDPEGLAVVVLRRSLDQVLASLIELGYFTAHNDDWRHWMHVARGAGVVAASPEPFAELDDIDLAIGYLFDVEARQQQFVTDHPGLRVVEADIAEIGGADGAARLLTELRIRPTERLEEVAGRATNLRSANRITQVPLAEMRSRILDYHHRAADQGRWAPDLTRLLDDTRP